MLEAHTVLSPRPKGRQLSKPVDFTDEGMANSWEEAVHLHSSVPGGTGEPAAGVPTPSVPEGGSSPTELRGVTDRACATWPVPSENLRTLNHIWAESFREARRPAFHTEVVLQL